jgi:putative alpha-1,2-mannosidase
MFLAATSGHVLTQVSDFESSHSHQDESSAPGYYRVLLSRWNINVELTATDRTGFARFTFPAGQPANVLVPINHTLNYTVAAQARVEGNREITGYVENRAFCGNQQTCKVYREFSEDFGGGHLKVGAPVVSGRHSCIAHLSQQLSRAEQAE